MAIKVFLGGDPTVNANWSPTGVPVSTDIAYLRNLSVDLTVADQSAIQLAELHIEQSYTGKTSSATAYWKIGADKLFIGEHYGYGSPAGSQRLMIDVGSEPCEVQILNSCSQSYDSTQPPIRLLCNDAATDIYVRKGKVGIATNAPGETSTLNTLDVGHSGNVSGDCDVTVGPDVTLTTLHKTGGNVVLRCGATTIVHRDGTLTAVGDGVIGTWTHQGGNGYPENTGGISTKLTLAGGTINAARSNVPRTWAAVEVADPADATLVYDPDVVTITAPPVPLGPVSVQFSAA